MMQPMSMNGRFFLLVLHVALVVPHMLSKNVFRAFVEFQDVQSSVLHSFSMDNCLQSFPTTKGAKEILMKLLSFLGKGGFEIWQWASNHVSVMDHLPAEVRSVDTDLWLSHDCTDPCEGTLGPLALLVGYLKLQASCSRVYCPNAVGFISDTCLSVSPSGFHHSIHDT